MFRGYFQWFECGLQCIIVVSMALTVVSGDNWLLGQIQGESIAERVGFGISYEY
jgi:hypothetical protein